MYHVVCCPILWYPSAKAVLEEPLREATSLSLTGGRAAAAADGIVPHGFTGEEVNAWNEPSDSLWFSELSVGEFPSDEDTM